MQRRFHSDRAVVAELISRRGAHCLTRDRSIEAAVLSLPEKIRQGLRAVGQLREQRNGLLGRLKVTNNVLSAGMDNGKLTQQERQAGAEVLADGARVLRGLDDKITALERDLLAEA